MVDGIATSECVMRYIIVTLACFLVFQALPAKAVEHAGHAAFVGIIPSLNFVNVPHCSGILYLGPY